MSRRIKIINFTACVLVLAFCASAFAQSAEFDAGMAAAQAGEFQKAVVHFQTSFNKTLPVSKQAQIHYNTGVCFYQLQQTDKAIEELEQAIMLKTNYEKAFYALAMVYSDAGNLVLAEMAFQKAIKLAGGRNGEAWFDLAFVYADQKKYDEALASFHKAIKYKTIAAAASYNNMGVIYALKGNLQAAVKEIEMAKTLGYSEAEQNLKYLRESISKGDKTLISKLTIEKGDFK